MRSCLSRFYRSLVILTALTSTNFAFASGSYSTGDSGDSFRSSGGDHANQLYNTGKSAVYNKLTCSDCPLAGQDVDATKATEIISMLTNKPEIAQKLSEDEIDAVIIYLTRRYNLN